MNIKKIIAVLLTLVLSLGIFAGCGSDSSADRELVLFTWEGMFPDDVLRDFTEETGIKVTYANFDTDEAMLEKLVADTAGSYDVVIADDYIIEAAIERDLVAKLDKDKLTHWDNIDPVYQGQFYDPTDEYTVPYGAGVLTLVYNPEEVDMTITGYSDLWDSSLENQVGIIGNYRVIDGMALQTMGKSLNEQDVDTIYQAGERLKELAPNIRTITDDNLQDKLITGEVNAAIMYTSQVTMAKIAKPELEVVFPEEGVGFGIMANFIPANAPHPEEAHEFINYILQPEVAAECFEFLGYYSTNKAANPLIDDEYRDFLTLPADFNPEKMEMIQSISAEAEEAHSLVWTEFQANR